MIFSLVSYSKGLGKITEKFVGECGENDREHLRVLENKQRKMDEYNKLKQELVNSQFPGVVLTEISFCDENDREHLKILKNEKIKCFNNFRNFHWYFRNVSRTKNNDKARKLLCWFEIYRRI